MRFVLLILLFNSLISFGQQKNDSSCKARFDTVTNLQVFTAVDKFPAVDGGMEALYAEISKRIKYPDGVRDRIESKVIVAFVVGNSGEISGKRVVKDITGTDLAKQILDIVDDVKWIPGFCDGKPVPTLLVLPTIIDVK